MINILLYIWQLPQNIIGYFLKRKSVFDILYKDITCYYLKNIKMDSFCFGKYLIINYKYCGSKKSSDIKLEEYNNYKLSKIFGPLYLFIRLFK